MAPLWIPLVLPQRLREEITAAAARRPCYSLFLCVGWWWPPLLLLRCSKVAAFDVMMNIVVGMDGALASDVSDDVFMTYAMYLEKLGRYDNES